MAGKMKILRIATAKPTKDAFGEPYFVVPKI